jgi:ABC-2 type transport system ATP-binding protein
MSHPAIATTDLGRDFGRKAALKDVTMNLPTGRILALLGPNGAGKTTFLRLLLGLIEPTRGEFELLGQSGPVINRETAHRVAGMSDMLEPPAGVSLRAMLDLQQGASPCFDRPWAEHLLEQNGLSPTQRYGVLSKGQKRWSLVTLVLASGAELLLLDEPADGLDPSARRKLYDHLRSCADERGATVLVTTHVIGDIERVADDVALINDGRLKLYASLEDIREHVREIELPDTRYLPEFPADVRVLGRRLVGGTTLAWVVCDVGNGAELQAMANGMAQVRPCSLETVYLAASEYATDYVDTRRLEQMV